MKKITIIFAALAVMFSTSAQNLGTGSGLAGITGSNIDVVGNIVGYFSLENGDWQPLLNPADDLTPFCPITIAYEVLKPDLRTWLNEDRDNRYLVLNPYFMFGDYETGRGFDHRSANFNTRWGKRFTRYENTDIWYITFRPADLFTRELLPNPNNDNVLEPIGTPWSEIMDMVGVHGADYCYNESICIVQNGWFRIFGDVFGVEFTGSVIADELGRPSRNVSVDPWTNPVPAVQPITLGTEFNNPFLIMASNRTDCDVQ